MPSSNHPILAYLRHRSWLIISAIYLAIAAVYVFTVPGRLGSWFNQPFLGTAIEPGMTVAAHGSLVSPEWREVSGQIPNASQLVALDGVPVKNPQDISRVLNAHDPGDPVTINLVTPTGEHIEFIVKLSTYSTRDRLVYFSLPLLISMLFLGCAGWVLVSGWKTSGAANLAMCNASAAVITAGFFDVYATQQQLAVWIAAIAIGGGALLHVALNFPDFIHLPGHWKRLRFLGYLSSTVVVLFVFIRLWGARAGIDFLITLRLATIYMVICLLAAAVIFLFRRIKSISPYERDLSTLFLFSSLISFFPVTLWWVLDSLQFHTAFTGALFIPIILFPLVSGYTIQHTHSLETDYRIMRVSTYALISLTGGLGYALLTGGIGLLWISITPIQSNLVNGTIIFLMALFIHPIRRAALTRVEPFLLQSERAFQDRIQTFSRELNRLDQLPEIDRVFRLYIEDTLHPERIQIFLYERKNDHYASQDSDLVFSLESPLVRLLAHRDEPLFIDDITSLPVELVPESSRLAILNLNIFLPLTGREHLTGWIALSPKRSGRSYSSREIAYLESLCDRAALTIERALTSQELQQRVRELDALADLARAVSTSFTLQDLAETIYLQTIRAFHAQDFRLVIEEPDSGAYRDLLSVEDGQRIYFDQGEEHTIHIPSLEMDMLRSGQALLSDDYTRECLKRGVMAASYGVYSWMGAPLKIHEKVTGGLFVGSREPATAFTRQQLGLLQAFASQIAGTIHQINLLAETLKQADQLSALNDLSHQIVSTLDLDLVLESTLKKAVYLMGGEAGSLLLIDKLTHELVFRTATGPVATDLKGKRLPEGSGVAGTAIQKRRPVVINNVRQAPEWLPQVDMDTGFATRALVAEPLLVKGQPIGVIEIVSGNGRAGFAADDLDLLASFAAQASLAIDNARLYSSLAEEYRSVHQGKSEFISTLAHELKNPMTSIRGYTELLAGGSVGPVNTEQSAFLAVIATNVDRMNRVVTELNDLSKLEAGRIRLELDVVSVAEALPDAVKLIRGALESRQSTVILPDNLQDLPLVRADRSRYTQILAGVLHNAVVYSPHGSKIFITASSEAKADQQTFLHLTIQDQGLGISPEDVPHLFEKYFRSQDPAVREVPGIGLSLYLARTFLAMQSGRIWYEAHPDGGSCFHIAVPAQT